jgi:hypothetical protein
MSVRVWHYSCITRGKRVDIKIKKKDYIMIGMERNRMNYSHIAGTQRESALAEEWKKQSADNKMMMMQSKKSPLQQAQQRQLAKNSEISKTKRIQTVQGIDSVDAIDNIDGIDGIEGDIRINAQSNFQTAGHFDLQQDIVDFIRPKALTPEYLKKNVLMQTSKNIMAHLEIVGASEALVKRAEALLEEENNVKSVTEAYRNALIFA